MNDSRTNDPFCAEAVPTVRTVAELINQYQTDPVSSFHRLRYYVRRNHTNILKRLADQIGPVELMAVKARDLKAWHLQWSDGGNKLSGAQQMLSQVRAICGYGATMLEDDQCTRIAMILHRLRLPHAPPRTSFLTAAQANAVRGVAHDMGWPSIALAQAIQFELMLRQKDCLGEWVPLKEPGETDVYFRGEKWLRGLRWEEIDDNLILRHRTSKRQKVLEINLNYAPMVVEELRLLIDEFGPVKLGASDAPITRDLLPKTGPLVINEITAMPWSASEYRRKWRIVATAAGIPKEVRNMDSRAGGITEATEAGADLEHVKHAATHSDIAQTQRYSRGAADKIEGVQKSRIQHRNKNKFLHGE
ncbi:hypothetical protein [Bradyrhizobium elkanii]|uniref:hypothetical protein n=1 Tax=Bradyrhizobium elkanii TaxID=29448 RepID=UPI0035168162